MATAYSEQVDVILLQETQLNWATHRKFGDTVFSLSQKFLSKAEDA